MLDETLAAIDAVDWYGLPGPRPLSPYHHDPAAGLRALAAATTLNQASDAAAGLCLSALMYDYMMAVYPAAVVAAPLLLDIAEHAHPQARASAAAVLIRAMDCQPAHGFTRHRAGGGGEAPLCCAIADLVHTRRKALTAAGSPNLSWLYGTAEEHWRFDVREAVGDADGVSAFGVLHGVIDGRPTSRGQLYAPTETAHFPTVAVEYPPDPDTGEACLRLSGIRPEVVTPGTVVRPAECGEKVD
ncbi:hypothetical protein ACWEQL_32575 [Kitasatospora sp. NPDC004240]